MQSRQHLCVGTISLHSVGRRSEEIWKSCEWICYKGLDVTCFFFFLLFFSMWFELLACRLLWVINTNEGVLFIFEILFWDVQAPCNRCLFIFIINNKKQRFILLFNPWFVQCLMFEDTQVSLRVMCCEDTSECNKSNDQIY